MVILPPRSSLGEVIGQSLSDVASHWAQHTSTTNALKQLGFSDAQARAYSHLGPQVQQQAIHAQQQQQAQERSNAAISQILGTGLSPAQYNQPSAVQSGPPMTQPMQMASQPQQRQQEAIQQATSIAQNPAFRKLQEQQQQAHALQNQQLMRQPAATGAQPITGEQAAILQAQAQQGTPRQPTYEDKLAQINRQRQALGAVPLSPGDRFRAEALLNSAEDRALKEEQHRQKQEDKREERIEKRENTLRKELETISKRAERAQQDIHSLEQIKVANDSGTLVQGPKRKLLENIGAKYGLDLQDYFTNTSTQYAAKTIERMQTGAGTAFGTGRLTNFIAEAYAKGLPRLANTQEGMDLIIKNVILENKGHVALNDEIRKIKAEYREASRPLPFDIEDQARERIQPKLDQYAEQSLNNINTAVNKQEAISSGKLKEYNDIPKASGIPEGAIMTDNKSGKRYRQTGGKWIPEGGQ